MKKKQKKQPQPHEAHMVESVVSAQNDLSGPDKTQ